MHGGKHSSQEAQFESCFAEEDIPEENLEDKDYDDNLEELPFNFEDCKHTRNNGFNSLADILTMLDPQPKLLRFHRL